MWCNTKNSSSLNYNRKVWQFPHLDLTLFMYHMNPETQHDNETESEPSNTWGKKNQRSSGSFTYAKDLIYLNYSFGCLHNLLLQPQKQLRFQNFFGNPFPCLYIIVLKKVFTSLNHSCCNRTVTFYPPAMDLTTQETPCEARPTVHPAQGFFSDRTLRNHKWEHSLATVSRLHLSYFTSTNNCWMRDARGNSLFPLVFILWKTPWLRQSLFWTCWYSPIS